MPVPSTILDLTSVPATNSPAGTESVKGTIDDYIRAHAAFIRNIYDQVLGPTVVLASAPTVNIGFAASQNIYISGSATITAFDNYAEGTLRWVVFGGTSVLTHNGVSLALPGGANIITTPGDAALFKSLGNGNWHCISYNRFGLRFPSSGTVLSDSTAVTIAQGGTGSVTAAAALTALGALPLAGGQMTGNLRMANNTGLFFKDSAGNLRQVFVYSADDNIYLSMGPGGFFRLQNAQATATIFAVDNNGTTSQAGRANAAGSTVANGTAATPAFGFADEAGMGFYRIGPGQLGISVGGVQVGKFTSAGFETINVTQTT
jgi:hypothetical protein